MKVVPGRHQEGNRLRTAFWAGTVFGGSMVALVAIIVALIATI